MLYGLFMLLKGIIWSRCIVFDKKIEKYRLRIMTTLESLKNY